MMSQSFTRAMRVGEKTPALRRGLYELKPTRDRVSAVHDRGLTGNSGSSLHAKTFSIDGRKVFIGSLNFDPRSTLLNTEMGFCD